MLTFFGRELRASAGPRVTREAKPAALQAQFYLIGQCPWMEGRWMFSGFIPDVLDCDTPIWLWGGNYTQPSISKTRYPVLVLTQL